MCYHLHAEAGDPPSRRYVADNASADAARLSAQAAAVWSETALSTVKVCRYAGARRPVYTADSPIKVLKLTTYYHSECRATLCERVTPRHSKAKSVKVRVNCRMSACAIVRTTWCVFAGRRRVDRQTSTDPDTLHLVIKTHLHGGVLLPAGS